MKKGKKWLAALSKKMGRLEKGRQDSGSVDPSCPAPPMASLGFHLLSASFYHLLLSLRVYLWGPQWENQVGSSSKATEKKRRVKLAFINESLFACQYKPFAIATYTTVHGSTVLSLWASKLLLTLFPAWKSLPHLLSFKLCCIVYVTIYTHDFYCISTICKDHFLDKLSILLSLFWSFTA